MDSEILQAIKKLGEKENIDKQEQALLDIIENGLNELYFTINSLEKKCSLLDYWRSNCLKNDKILEILKECPFVLDSIYRNTNNSEFSKKYQFGTITNSQLEIIKRWLGLCN